MAIHSNKDGKTKLNLSEMIALSSICNYMFRYDKELESTRWSSIRKGAIFGIFSGWLSFITYVVYASGFVVGFLLKFYGIYTKLSISDIIVVIFELQM